MINRRQPPPGVWLAALLLVLVFLIAMARVDIVTSFARVQARADDDRMNLARLTRRPDNPGRVLAIGSSKIWYAIEYDEVFARRIQHADQLPTFTRLTWLDARYSNLEPALNLAARHPPAVLMIESDLVSIDREARLPIRDNLRALEKYLRWIAAGNGGRGNAADENRAINLGRDVFPDEDECRRRVGPGALAQYRSTVANWRLMSSSRRERYLAPLRTMAKEGTRVVLLDLPRSAQADSAFPRAFALSIKTLLATIANNEGFEVWAPPALPDDAYCDQGHVNAKGRDVISAWLAQKLSGAPGATHG